MNMLQNLNINAYVLLKRLSEEEIDRLTGRNRNDQTFYNSHVQTVRIKQEFPENVYTENYENSIENNTWQSQEYTSVVKIETTTTAITEIKTEPLEDYEGNIHGTFKCDMCYEVFNDFEMLFIHKSLDHKNNNYVCEFCDKRFSLSLHLNIHLAEHVNDFCMNRRAPAEIQSSSKSNLALEYNNSRPINFLQNSFNNNRKNVQNKKNLKQKKLCEKKVSPQKYVTYNSNTILQNTKECKPFKCPNCLFSSTSENEFLNHHTFCNTKLDNSYRSKDDLFRCHLCVKTFINQTALNGHMKYHSIRGEIIPRRKYKNVKLNNIAKTQNDNRASKVNQCKKCNKNFISRRKLNIHYKQHQKHMVCESCNKQFFLKKSYEKHLLTHKITTEKKNNGNTSFNENHSFSSRNSKKRKSLKIKFTTNKIANDKKQLKNPLKKTQSFYCSFCNKYYKTIKSLGEHKRRYHAYVKPKLQRLASIKCNWCSAVITKCNLTRHINSFHPNVKPIKCTHCSMKFKNHSSMKLHVNDSHKN